jgi:cobalamin biosynthesis protein CbiG
MSPGVSDAEPGAPGRSSVAVGIGCNRGTSLQTLRRAVFEALEAVRAGHGDVAVIATVDRKANEPGLLALIETEGWPARFFSADDLARIDVSKGSARVQRLIGTPSVSAAAALLAAGQFGGALIAHHRFRDDAGCFVTVSLARMGRDCTSIAERKP